MADERLDRLRAAESLLHQADNPIALDRAHALLLSVVKQRRKHDDSHLGILAQCFEAGMDIWQKQIAEGLPHAERVATLAKTLRGAWAGARLWRYDCDSCDDTGLVLERCVKGHRCDGVSARSDGAHTSSGKYRRLCATHPESDYEHTYGVPCFCSKGERFRPRAVTHQDDETEAGKVRGFSRPSGKR